MDKAPTYERKFAAGPELKTFALEWLRHACLPEPDYPEAVLFTVYYDTPGLRSLAEKADGDHSKTKYRLRWYEPDRSPDPDSHYAFFEIKRKAGDGRHKQRTRIMARRETLRAMDFDAPWFASVLREAGEALGVPLDPGLAPMVLLRYRRHRFICPFTMASVSLDTEIAVVAHNPRRLALLAPRDVPATVLEFKDLKRENPEWMRPLLAAGFMRRGFSKYAECIGRLTWEG